MRPALDRSLHILLVDDEEIVQQTIGDFLDGLGHRVDGVGDAPAALEAAGASHYDLAIIDVGLPRMNGLALLEKIREDHAEIPVIMIAGHGDVEIRTHALGLGAAHFLVKPLRLLELETVLREAVRIR